MLLFYRSVAADMRMDIITVHNGKEAVDYVRDSGEGCVDLLFMDCEMPIMDGYDATVRIRSYLKEEGL